MFLTKNYIIYYIDIISRATLSRVVYARARSLLAFEKLTGHSVQGRKMYARYTGKEWPVTFPDGVFDFPAL